MDPTSMFTRPEMLGGVPQNQQRAKILTVDKKGKPLRDERHVELEFQFNPEQLTVSKSVKWSEPEKGSPNKNAPDLNFGGGQPATFSLDLTFDTSQGHDEKDVRQYTQELLKLVMLGKEVSGYGQTGTYRLRPPRVQFQWGKLVLFLAVVTDVNITYTLFLPDGTPVRAKSKVTFKQLDETDDSSEIQNPTTRTVARKTRIVRAGDRLDLISYEEYGHPSHWRYLAEVNDLLDPRALQPGQILSVPPLP
jgi:nucleoid-associated protein YgaU